MSAPAAKAFSEPVMTMAPMPSSDSKSFRAAVISLTTWSLSALSALGRLRVMRPTRPRFSAMIISKLMLSPCWFLGVRGWGLLSAVGLRLDHCAHPAGRDAWLAAGGVGGEVVLGDGVVLDVVAGDLVAAAGDLGAVEELGLLAAAVVLDALGFALDVFGGAIATLAEGGQAFAGRGGDAVLEAGCVLGHDQLVAANRQRALGEDDAALEDVHLVAVVDGEAVGLDVDRLVAVGLLGECGLEGAGEGEDSGQKQAFHEGDPWRRGGIR